MTTMTDKPPNACQTLREAVESVTERYAALAEAYGSEVSCVFDGCSWTTCESEEPSTVCGTAGSSLSTKECAVAKPGAISTQISTPAEDTEAAASPPLVTSQCALSLTSGTPVPITDSDMTSQKPHSGPDLRNVPPCPLGLWRKKAPEYRPHDKLRRILGEEQWHSLFSGNSGN